MATILAAMGLVVAYLTSGLVLPLLVQWDTWDVWFQADIPRVFSNMTDRWSHHGRVSVHPLFSLFTFPAVRLLVKALHVDPAIAVRLLVAGVSGLCLSLCFAVLRLLGARQSDALLFTAIVMVSAAAMFWSTVPETYPFGAAGILAALALSAWAPSSRLSPLWYVTINVVTLAATTTNWMAGLFATMVRYLPARWPIAASLASAGLVIAVLLWTIEKQIFPTAAFFLKPVAPIHFLLPPEAGGPFYVLTAFLFHSLIMPAIYPVSAHHWNVNAGWPQMSVQLAVPGSGGPWGLIAATAWFCLLGLGLWSLTSLREHRAFRVVLGLTLLGQLLLHLVYGEETFLYAFHYGPLLVLMAALGILTKARPVVLSLAAVLFISMAVNNAAAFQQALKFLQNYAPPRFQVLNEQRTRPSDPWPEGHGRVLLAIPGSAEMEKGYHQYGGNFSPAIGSFGVSIWLLDRQGLPMVTSDTRHATDSSQGFDWSASLMPRIRTLTPYYDARWAVTSPGHWRLDLVQKHLEPGRSLAIVIRSVGPSGGPLYSLVWDGSRLMLNQHWTVTITPVPKTVQLGEEGSADWLTGRPQTARQWNSPRGWGYARLTLDPQADSTVTIQDRPETKAEDDISATQRRSKVTVRVPDERFTSSLDAQIAHLLMGVVDDGIRPGDPMNYPLPWVRPAAYVLVALARAGHVALARELAQVLALQDFFGEFGAEADAPGFALWALEEVASRARDPSYDRWLWPHVQRKAQLITNMMSTDRPLYGAVSGPIVERLRLVRKLALICNPPSHGLISGRIQFGISPFFVSAVSSRGLLDAAALATRLGELEAARGWTARASALQEAWQQQLKPGLDRPYGASFWPAGVPTATAEPLRQELEENWAESRDVNGGFRFFPASPHLALAEAHQWLLLGESNRMWSTLEWLWAHQSSPGLYTLWDTQDGANTLHRWNQVRTITDPLHATPHYWAAAELLLLQLDALAYSDASSPSPTVVIGAGVPAAWLRHPITVKGLSLRERLIDWAWDGHGLTVTMDSPAVVRLGSAFPPSTPIQIHPRPPSSIAMELRDRYTDRRR